MSFEGNTVEAGLRCLVGMGVYLGHAGGVGGPRGMALSDRRTNTAFGLKMMGLGCVRDWRGGPGVCVEGGGAARGGRRKGKAFEGGGDGLGEPGVCIAARVFLASLRLAAGVAADPQASVNPSPCCESVSPRGSVSVRLSACKPCVSVRLLASSQRCVSVHPWRASLRPATASFGRLAMRASVCLSGHLASGEVSLCPWAVRTEEGEGSVEAKIRRRGEWMRGVWRDERARDGTRGESSRGAQLVWDW